MFEWLDLNAGLVVGAGSTVIAGLLAGSLLRADEYGLNVRFFDAAAVVAAIMLTWLAFGRA